MTNESTSAYSGRLHKSTSTHSGRLLRDRDRGATVVCSAAPYEGRAMDYAPRRKSDPSPWVLAGVENSFRYSGLECHSVWPNGKPERPQPLGEVQQHCLRAMADYQGWWRNGGGWMWENRSRTVKIMKSLAARGLAEEVCGEEYRESYRLTEAGWRESGGADVAR